MYSCMSCHCVIIKLLLISVATHLQLTRKHWSVMQLPAHCDYTSDSQTSSCLANSLPCCFWRILHIISSTLLYSWTVAQLQVSFECSFVFWSYMYNTFMFLALMKVPVQWVKANMFRRVLYFIRCEWVNFYILLLDILLWRLKRNLHETACKQMQIN